MNTAVDDLWLQ